MEIQDWESSPNSDEARFAEVYVKTAGHIVSYCARRLDSRDDSEDAASDVFLIAWRRRRDLFAADVQLAWLYAVAHGVVRNHLRSRHRAFRLVGRIRRSATTGVVPDISTRVATEIDAQRDAADLLERLDPTDREIVRLLSWEELQPKEIAHIVGMAEGTVRSRLYRIRKAFTRDDIHPTGESDGPGEERA